MKLETFYLSVFRGFNNKRDKITSDYDSTASKNFDFQTNESLKTLPSAQRKKVSDQMQACANKSIAKLSKYMPANKVKVVTGVGELFVPVKIINKANLFNSIYFVCCVGLYEN